MVCNAAKSLFTLHQLGWSLHPPGRHQEWIGLTDGWSSGRVDPPNRRVVGWNKQHHWAHRRAYRRFAAEEAHGHSPLYQEMSLSVAADPKLISFLARLPGKQQPNLLLGAVCLLLDCDHARISAAHLDNGDALRASKCWPLNPTTNPDAARRCCQSGEIPEPLALIEVGALAGLCLLPDLYAYDYSGRILRGPGAAGADIPVRGGRQGTDPAAPAGNRMAGGAGPRTDRSRRTRIMSPGSKRWSGRKNRRARPGCARHCASRRRPSPKFSKATCCAISGRLPPRRRVMRRWSSFIPPC